MQMDGILPVSKVNDITKDSAFYTTTSRFVAWLGAFPQERQS